MRPGSTHRLRPSSCRRSYLRRTLGRAGATLMRHVIRSRPGSSGPLLVLGAMLARIRVFPGVDRPVGAQGGSVPGSAVPLGIASASAPRRRWWILAWPCACHAARPGPRSRRWPVTWNLRRPCPPPRGIIGSLTVPPRRAGRTRRGARRPLPPVPHDVAAPVRPTWPARRRVMPGPGRVGAPRLGGGCPAPPRIGSSTPSTGAGRRRRPDAHTPPGSPGTVPPPARPPRPGGTASRAAGMRSGSRSATPRASRPGSDTDLPGRPSGRGPPPVARRLVSR